MAPKTNKNAPGTKVYDFTAHPTRVDEIAAAIAQTPKMMIVCGPGVSFASGMPGKDTPLQLLHNGYASTTTLGAAIEDCSILNPHAKQLSDDKLAAFSVAMTRLRIRARTAPLSPFHQFLQRVFREERAVLCLTENSDGLETRDAPEADGRLVTMHGDNRWLRCSTPHCPGVEPQQVAELDERLLSAEIVQCPSCTAKAAAMKSQRLAGPPALRSLRPAVQSYVDGPLQPGGKMRENIISAAEGCNLLLVVGVSLKSRAIFTLVRDIAAAVHGQYGAVVYIDHKAIKGLKTDHCIDIHLKVDAQKCSEHIMRAMDQVVVTISSANGDIDMTFEEDNDPSDLWYDVLNNDLAREVTLERPPWTKPRCCVCNLGVMECLLQCLVCKDYMCYPGQYNADAKYRCCIVPHTFSTTDGQLLGRQSIDEFICPFCWDHRERGIYPHYVRPAPRVLNQEPDDTAPRIAMIVYFLDQFWPQAKHLCALVAGRWTLLGWPSYVQPIKLEELDDKRDILGDCPWVAGSFDLFVVYITHGLSESRGYQLSHKVSLSGPELFDRTMAPAEGIFKRAKSTHAFLACCGVPFGYPDTTRELQQWMNHGGVFNTLVGCLNQKLAPAYLVNFIAKASMSQVGVDEPTGEEILECWLSDGLVCNHTDLIFMAKGLPPCMWIFAPFDSRPLGKELPNLLGACSCQREGAPGGDDRPRRRKVWIVSHDGSARHGKPLRDVQVKARCSRCSQAWVMPVESLNGHLHVHGGLYAAVVPYFASH
ncbi:hypothetical protein FRC08_011407 [Ceratobasidium sp. 394]|nr:hypothetical protein FRC08_011407 [Ceratobasidium sp. 394]